MDELLIMMPKTQVAFVAYWRIWLQLVIERCGTAADVRLIACYVLNGCTTPASYYGEISNGSSVGSLFDVLTVS